MYPSTCVRHQGVYLEKVIYEPRREKTINVVSEQVRHKPSCTNTEDGYRLEILDIDSRGIVLPV